MTTIPLDHWIWTNETVEGGHYERTYDTVLATVTPTPEGSFIVGVTTGAGPSLWEQVIGEWDDFGEAIDEAESAGRMCDEEADQSEPDDPDIYTDLEREWNEERDQ